MFLAINELIKEKSRFILITIIIILVSYLTFFLTSLAYGLATSYTQGVDSWKASGVTLQKDANNAIGRSLLTEVDYKGLLNKNAAPLGVGVATAQKDGSDDVTLFGVNMDSFLAPTISEGRLVSKAGEIVASDELKKIGIMLGDNLRFSGANKTYVIVGFVSNATFQTAPIVYMELSTWREVVSDISGMNGMRDNTTISAVITRGVIDRKLYVTNETDWQTIRDFTFTLPGYQAQVLTFSLMIGFLIGIASFVLAIFMYILTLQKKSVFGVLKAEGVSNAYIGWSVIIQVAILLFVGIVIGLGMALLTGWLLSAKVPFMVNPVFYGGVAVLFIVCSAIGAIASVRSVTRIDPVEAIG